MTVPPPGPCERKILHVDMDAFFAAVEQRDHPELRGRPLVVGGDPRSRGVVATCSYEARAYGIRSAMPAAHAARLCPGAVFIRPRFAAYREASEQVMQILRAVSPMVEPLALDEAYIDVTEQAAAQGGAVRLARRVRKAIHDAIGLTASAGVSYNKLFAKYASDLNKPDGLHWVLPSEGPDLAKRMRVEQFFGIGTVTRAKLNRLGIHTGSDLLQADSNWLAGHLGPARARQLQRMSAGIDPRAVVPERPRKSSGAETTFAEDLNNRGAMLHALDALVERVAGQLRTAGVCASTLTLKVRFSDFRLCTRSQTPGCALDSADKLRALLPALLERAGVGTSGTVPAVRLLGVTAGGLTPQTSIPQLPLWAAEP